MFTEINFDGLVGPSHNYAGLSLGNLASARNFGKVSRPRDAALQGLAKMRANLERGLAQGLFLPQRRPERGLAAAAGHHHAGTPARRCVPMPCPLRRCGRPMPLPSRPRPIRATGAATSPSPIW